MNFLEFRRIFIFTIFGVLPTFKFSRFAFVVICRKYFNFLFRGFGNQESSQTSRSFKNFITVGFDNCGSGFGAKSSSSRRLESALLSNRVSIPANCKWMTKWTVLHFPNHHWLWESFINSPCGSLICNNYIAIFGSFFMHEICHEMEQHGQVWSDRSRYWKSGQRLTIWQLDGISSRITTSQGP